MSDEMFEDEYIELAQGRAYWQARAIAAERRVAELEARLIDVDMAQISTANELEAIAASLGLTYDAWPGFAPILQDIEMRLAEQGWRPVTEPPEKDDRYLVWWKGASWIDSPALALYSKFSDVWLYDDSDEPYDEPPDYWQTITPPPTATE